MPKHSEEALQADKHFAENQRKFPSCPVLLVCAITIRAKHWRPHCIVTRANLSLYGFCWEKPLSQGREGTERHLARSAPFLFLPPQDVPSPGDTSVCLHVPPVRSESILLLPH